MTDDYLSPSPNTSVDPLPRPSSPSDLSSTVTVVTGEPVTITPDYVLDHLFDGTKCAVDVDDLVQAARELYCQIDGEELSSSHPGDGTVIKEIRAATKDYSEAIKMSVKMAEHGIIFAVDAVSLCERLSGHSGKDICLFINKM
ncbi:hypothetical protein PILCRDRAFT_6598 [Piloderma croceum F 1598]|uniref:Uncharacterized protein n=1 Tax=Piloderma croceum (strain F 1598) TaxID=765440 RepID=A0A0C3FIX6_PILCF|nr:hypothetical protein PILCRDRAFT_6598 [Piloderma croceum F 1598]